MSNYISSNIVSFIPPSFLHIHFYCKCQLEAFFHPLGLLVHPHVLQHLLFSLSMYPSPLLFFHLLIHRNHSDLSFCIGHSLFSLLCRSLILILAILYFSHKFSLSFLLHSFYATFLFLLANSYHLLNQIFFSSSLPF